MKAHLYAVGLVVDDMARSLAFYRRLGIDIPLESDEQPHTEVELPDGGKLLFDTVETIRSFDPDWTPPSGAHRISLAFRVSAPGDVDAAYEDLLSCGYQGHLPPWDAFWGQRYAIVYDPDGNAVDLFAPLDAS